MSDKSQLRRRTPHVASLHPKRPYKALLIRAQSPEPTEENSTDNETGSQELGVKPGKDNDARKAPYKALLIRARSPEPHHEEISTDDEATSSKELEVKPRKNNDARKEPNKNKIRTRKNNAPKRIISHEPEVKHTIANPCNMRGSKKKNIMSEASDKTMSEESEVNQK